MVLTKKQKIALGIGVLLGIGAIYGISKLSDSFGWWANLMAKLKGKPKAPPQPQAPPPSQYTIKPTGVKFGISGWSEFKTGGLASEKIGREVDEPVVYYYSCTVNPNPLNKGFSQSGIYRVEGYIGEPNANGYHKENSKALSSTATVMRGSIIIPKADFKASPRQRAGFYLYLS